MPEVLVLHNADLEKKVLGMILLNPETWDLYDVRQELFWDVERNRLVKLWTEIKKDNGQIDDVQILISRGVSETLLLELTNAGKEGLVHHFKQDLEELVKFYKYRESLKLIEEIKTESKKITAGQVDEFLRYLDQQFIKITGLFREEKSPFIKDILTRLQEVRTDYKEKRIVGYKSGIEILDNCTGGFLPRFFWVVGAYTNVGKSRFSLQMILNVLRQGGKVVLFSLEMSDLINASRMLSNSSGLGSLEIFQGNESAELKECWDWLGKQDLMIYDNKWSINEMQAIVKKHKNLGGVDLVIIDYAQNLVSEGDIYSRMSRAALESSFLAQDNHCAVLLVSQISNEGARSKKGDVISYKGAGELASAPDVGLFLERLRDREGETRDNRLLCKIVKNRHGMLGKIYLKVDPLTGFIRQDENQNYDEYDGL